jgi:hypothetical protein
MTARVTYGFEEPASAALTGAFDRTVLSIESVLDIDFVLVDGPADIWIIQDNVYGPAAATIGLPSTVWIDPSLEQSYGFGKGTYGGFTTIHEFLHSLGLSHPHDYGDDATMADSAVSYVWITSTNGQTLYPEEPGLKDIVDLAGIYGLNMASAGDGTVWRVDRANRIDTVYDVGGKGDVLDLRDILIGCDVDMTTMIVDMHDGWVFSAGIEAVQLGRGVDMVTLGAGMLLGLGKGDVLVTDDTDADKLTKGEKRALGLDGKWWELGDTLIAWSGPERKLEAMIVGGAA